MSQIRELLRLHFEEGFSQRMIARVLGVARSSVERVLKRFAACGLTWPLNAALSDAELERAVYRRPAVPVGQRCARPNYTDIARELARKGVTRRLLWQEYRDQHVDGIGYSVFCDELAAFMADRDLAYRHDHVPGEKGYFDFSGLTMRYRVDHTVCQAQIFTAALGWSNAIFAHAYADQTAASWLDGQHRAFVAFGGVPKIGVPDNPKPLIAHADRYEPRLTAVYADFARHYGLVVLPARVRKPKDKASVEGAVKIVQMRVLATARDRIFPSLIALNTWLAQEIATLNAAPFQKRVGSRLSLLQQERAHLAALPATAFEAPTYLVRKVARDYHVDVHRQYYSVPYQHAGQTVQVRLTREHVEVLRHDTRIALHHRAPTHQRFVTEVAHMPAHHRAFRDPNILRRAAAIGPQTVALIEALFAKRRHPEQAIRSAQGVLALARDHTHGALEAACQRAVALDTIGYEAVRRQLLIAQVQPALPLPVAVHEHVRGSAYYSDPNAQVEHHVEVEHVA
jgi:transposase